MNAKVKKPTVKTPALVLIEWVDAEHEFGWQEGNDIDEKDHVLTCFTVGWLMRQSKLQVRVCQTFSAENHAQILTIPKGMITKLTVLQQPTSRYVNEDK